MLPKTLQILKSIPRGQYVADDVVCYDDAEMQELAATLKKLVFAPSKLRRFLQEAGVTITRSDVYSEIPKISEIEDAFSKKSNICLDYIFQDADFLKNFLIELSIFSNEFDPPKHSSDPAEYSWTHGPFSYSDAMSYYCMIRKLKPKNIIEIGCGTSTLVAQAALKKNGSGRHIAIEPFPKDFLYGIENIELIKSKAQDIQLDFLNKNLSDGDILFIDTTHTVRHNSDCLYIYLTLLPFIQHDIIVHVHDIYLPDTLPLQMMRDHQVYWGEQYLLYAYLIRNKSTKVLFGSNYHKLKNQKLLQNFMHGRHPEGGASFWFSQSKANSRG
ncbi:class I SAM-dependent methyltransferase [Sediminicoccus sp. KRV36]|uniref:class I SAM-dependent methyltransferase n=1 Tax=Sediminicoccus sp. KRV36 TaxID=3133721 RepID=UPI00200CD809|nr:class I SAM-dependent methyltransferase [Sediminicoccus rosea]UPY38108.1 class I SAM-dependent methyltransferase [Sediminicoccus rosea]